MGLAGLGRNHSSRAIEEACASALNLSAHRLRDIQSILKQGAAATPCQELLPWPDGPPDPATTPCEPAATPITFAASLSKTSHPGPADPAQPNVIRDLLTYSQFIQTRTVAGAP